VADWPDGPPLEAYSRVTNPERFRPLHTLALALLDRLAAEYDVLRTEEFDLSYDMTPSPDARPPVRLVPARATAAPIAIAFSTQPSLAVRYGLWRSEPFPSCACDACAATAEGEFDRLRREVEHVVAGRFTERVAIPFIGGATLAYTLGENDGSGRGWGRGRRAISRAQARALVGDGPREMRWQPWPRRARP
jgi:Family of unknown function (DUF6226)